MPKSMTFKRTNIPCVNFFSNNYKKKCINPSDVLKFIENIHRIVLDQF